MNTKELAAKLLDELPNTTKWRKDFIANLFWLLCACRGRHNFENLARQSTYNESTFRNNYGKPFDFMGFNQELIREYCSDELVVAFDPSFISKSGKCTPGLGYFWSGCAGQTKKGLEIGGFGAVDILNNTCMHLVCRQTLLSRADGVAMDSGNLLAYYSELIFGLREQLQETSTHLAVDAYFSKRPFIDRMMEAQFTVVSRFRKDVALRYRYLGPKRPGPGRQKVFDGKVDLRDLREECFTLIVKDVDLHAYEGTVYATALKRWVKAVVVHHFGRDGSIKKVCTFFSTDSQMQGADILVYYKGRFQIEFLYRDAKQFVGLEEGESRKQESMDFHFNAALTAVSLAKAVHHLSVDRKKRKPFSMSSVKTLYANDLLINKILSVFGIDPEHGINKQLYNRLREFGAIAA